MTSVTTSSAIIDDSMVYLASPEAITIYSTMPTSWSRGNRDRQYYSLRERDQTVNRNSVRATSPSDAGVHRAGRQP